MRFAYYPDTDSLYIELNPGRKRKPGGTQEVVGRGTHDIVIDVDGDGVPVGMDIDSFASEIVDLTRLEAEGPIFRIALMGSGIGLFDAVAWTSLTCSGRMNRWP